MAKKLPYQRIILPNGLTVLLYSMKSVQSVFATIYIHTGAVFENKKTNGLSHFVEHLVHQGTRNFPQPRALSETLESEGITENGGTDKFKTFFWIKAPYSKLDRALKGLSELIFFPSLPEERINHVRQIIASEYKDFWQHPENQFAQMMLVKRFLQENHPYTNDSLGLVENIRLFNHKDVVAWKKRFYHPANMVLSIAGNFSYDKAILFVKKFFGQTEKGRAIKEPKFGPNGYSNFLIYNYKINRDQIQFLLSFPVFGWREVERFKRLGLSLMGEILGGGPVSRLFKLLREEKSLVYWVQTGARLFPWKGGFLISGSTSRNDLTQVMELIHSEVKRVLDQGFLEKEVIRGKNILNSMSSFRFESPESIANYFASEEFWQEGIWLPEDYIAAGNKITKRELEKLAEKVFDFSKLNIGLMGKVEQKKIEKTEKIFKKREEKEYSSREIGV